MLCGLPEDKEGHSCHPHALHIIPVLLTTLAGGRRLRPPPGAGLDFSESRRGNGCPVQCLGKYLNWLHRVSLIQKLHSCRSSSGIMPNSHLLGMPVPLRSSREVCPWEEPALDNAVRDKNVHTQNFDILWGGWRRGPPFVSTLSLNISVVPDRTGIRYQEYKVEVSYTHPTRS